MNIEFTSVRKEYERGRLLEIDAPVDPLPLFQVWLGEAVAANIGEPNAMTLATATAEGRPSARVVLLKGVDGRGFSFFTNYESRKGEELANNPWAALCFWWSALERQVRIEGQVERLSTQESDAYYNLRPLGARIGAIVSAQSRVIANRDDLEARYFALQAEYFALQAEYSDTLPDRPAYWGGYLLRPHAIEFWQGGAHRLHDRLRYSKTENDDWRLDRLSP